MTYYSKLIAAVVGLLVLIASRYGVDLEGQQQVIVEALIAVFTAVSVFLVKNKPATESQLREERTQLKEAAKDVAEE